MNSALLQAVVDGLLIGAVYALIAAGLSLIFGIMDIVNFAHGELLMIGMYIAFYLWSVFKLDPLVAIPVSTVGVAVAGLLEYRLIIQPVLGKALLSRIVVTFGMMIFLRGAAQFLFSANPKAVRNPFMDTFRFDVGGIALGGSQLAAAGGAVLCIGALTWFITKTEMGNAVRAAGEDAGAVSLLGISPNRMYAIAWIVGAGSTGVAAALVMNSYSAAPMAGATFGLIAFITVALGGFGNVVGAGLAGLSLGVIQNVVGLYEPAYTFAALLGLYLVINLIRPKGLFGVR